jgi:hypothetical protein
MHDDADGVMNLGVIHKKYKGKSHNVLNIHAKTNCSFDMCIFIKLKYITNVFHCLKGFGMI